MGAARDPEKGGYANAPSINGQKIIFPKPMTESDKTSVSDKTITQTVWSDSLLAPLLDGLKAGKDDEWINQKVASIEKRGQIPVEYLVYRAGVDLGPEYADRLKQATGAKPAAPEDEEDEGLLSKFIGLLKK